MSIITQSRKLPVFFLLGITGLIIAWSALRSPPSASAGLVLRPPSFATEVITSTAFLSEEAGITAYVYAGQPIRLDYVQPIFRTVEDQTDDYLIGSVAVPTGAGISFDVHVYVHRTGWMVAYYPNDEPVSKMLDWVNGLPGPTNLDLVLERVAAKDGITAIPDAGYYDFRYPDATHIMFVEKSRSGIFEINIPTDFEVYERSWIVSALDGRIVYNLDGEKLYNVDYNGWQHGYGFLSAEQLLPDLLHTFKVSVFYASESFTCLVLVYREPDAP